MKKRLILSFIIPVLAILLVFLVLGISPFGDKSIIIIDANTQYISFITYLRTIMSNLNNLKYTFSTTLGSNLIPLLGYYMMSPLNLITLLFKPENMQLALTIIILLKIGLSGLSMEYFLQKKYPNKNTLLFSLCYALMSYSIVYMYHIMWLDAVILFPIIILGIDNIFKNKSPLLYIISLSLSIILNYYMGIIVCLGSVIYFIYKYILEHKTIKKLKTIINYSISSLLAGLTSMFIIIPTLIGLGSGKATFSLSNLKFGISISYLEVIAKSFTASVGEGETWHGGPMIACGMIIVVLLILYFLNKKISKREKIINGLFVFFLASTFAITSLDLLFHGLNTPNCFDYRHAFIFVFFIILIAINSYMNLKVNKKDIFITGIILFVLSALIYICKYDFNKTTYGLTILLSLIISFIILLVLLKNKKPYKVLFIITVIDLFINVLAGVVMITMSDKVLVSKYKEHVTATNEIVDKLKEYDSTFYRMEKTYDRSTKDSMLTLNDSMIFNYNGISHFDSTTRSDVEIFLENFGFRRLLTRTYYNKEGSTTAADMLFGIKYVLSDSEYKNYEEILTTDNLSIYENPYYLPVAYKIEDDNINLDNDSVFENMNSVITSFTNIDNDIYRDASYQFDNYKEDDKYIYTYNIEVEKTDEIYFHFPCDDALSTNYNNGKMYVNGVEIGIYFSKYNWGVMSLGEYNVGDEVEVKFVFDKEVSLNDPYFVYEDKDVLKEHHDILSSNVLNLEKINNSRLKGKIELESDSKIIITIPYDEGWNVKVDGKSIQKTKSLDVLMSIELDKGVHNVELIYTPKGLKEGVIISLSSVALIIIYLYIRKRIH